MGNFSAVNFSDHEFGMNTILSEFPEKILISGMGARGCALVTKDSIQYFVAVELDNYFKYMR